MSHIINKHKFNSRLHSLIRNNIASCKRSQLKIQQMAFMLMAVFIFFILVGMFYLVFQSRNIKEQAQVAERNKAIEMANMLVNSAEFTCGDYCVDGDRAMVLANRKCWT